MSKEATLGQLIEMCNTVGWLKGVQALEAIVQKNENAQAVLFASGSQSQINIASKLSKTITTQNFTIAKLKAMPEYLAELENQQP